MAKAIREGEEAERRRVKAREWYYANREHRLAQNTAWRAPRRAELEARAKVVRDTPEAKQGQKDRNDRWYAKHREVAIKKAKVWKSKNPEAVKASAKKNYDPLLQKKRRFKSEYNLSFEDYEAMVIAQNGCCAICLNKSPRLDVDHDHVTNKVRGLLCSLCNPGLGFFKDKAELLLAASEYLKKYK